VQNAIAALSAGPGGAGHLATLFGLSQPPASPNAVVTSPGRFRPMSPGHNRPPPSSSAASLASLAASLPALSSSPYAPVTSAPYTLPATSSPFDFANSGKGDPSLQRQSQAVARASDRSAALNVNLDAVQKNLDRLVANLPADPSALEALGLRTPTRASGSAPPPSFSTAVDQGAGVPAIWPDDVPESHGFDDFNVDDFLNTFGAYFPSSPFALSIRVLTWGNTTRNEDHQDGAGNFIQALPDSPEQPDVTSPSLAHLSVPDIPVDSAGPTPSDYNLSAPANDSSAAATMNQNRKRPFASSPSNDDAGSAKKKTAN
jgi:hypothetical protein